MKERLYLAYGSNLNLEQMSFRCPTARVVGPVLLQNYKLVFRGHSGGAVATIERAVGSSVPCLVWSIQPSDEEALDRYEGYPFLYTKRSLPVWLDDRGRVDVMVYVMCARRPVGPPGEFYLNTILQGYRSAGFDPQFLLNAMEV